MLRITILAVFLCATALSGCASTPSLSEGEAIITVADTYGGVNKNISISSVDGSGTGILIQPKSVQVKPGKHTVVQNVFCNGCAYEGKHSFEINAAAGHTYYLPQQFGTGVIRQ